MRGTTPHERKQTACGFSTKIDGASGKSFATMNDPPPIIDWQAALSNAGDDNELFLEVKATAMKEIQSLLPRLREALNNNDADRTQYIAHTLKGAARVIAATKTRLIAERIEQAANAEDLERAKATIDQLDSAIRELITTLMQSDDRPVSES